MSQLRTVKLRCFVRHDRLWCVKLSGVLNSSICTVCFTPLARFIPKRRDTDSGSIFETCAPPHYPMATCHPDRRAVFRPVAEGSPSNGKGLIKALFKMGQVYGDFSIRPKKAGLTRNDKGVDL